MSAAAAETETDQVTSDERLARELQQQENMQQQQQQLGLGWSQGQVAQGPVAQMGMPIGTRGPPPVVQGVVVGGHGGMHTGMPNGMSNGMPHGIHGGAPIVIGAPTGVAGGGLPYVVTEEISFDELLVLRYRFSLMCFTCIDAFSTILNAVGSIMDFRGTRQAEVEDRIGQKNREGLLGGIPLGVIALVFLVGPACGYVGAKRLQRTPVSVYLAFCACKTVYEFIMVALRPKIWYVIIALIQMWVTKIVLTFWRALGKIGPERCADLANPNGALGHSRVRMAYW